MELQVHLDVECGGQCEKSPDELYVTGGFTRNNSATLARCLWEGSLVAAPNAKNRTGLFEAWRGELHPHETAALLINLNEQNGTDYQPGKILAEQMVRRVAGCLAEAQGDLFKALACIEFEPLLKRATAASGCLSGDRLLGSFLMILSYGEDHRVQGRLHPIALTQPSPCGRLLSTGHGSAYATEIRINGHPLKATAPPSG